MPPNNSDESFARAFVHACRSGKSLLALKSLRGYAGELRPHQIRALERFPEVLAGPRRKCMMVFSTLPVLQQFMKDTLKKAVDSGLVPTGSVVAVCSAEDVVDETWYSKVTEPWEIEEIMKKKDENVLIVTTYASAKKVDDALRAVNGALDLAVFDEAHFSAL